ncbi:hypothetical protein HELRODRAFT_183733 [Helobdella robusta]|uniref:Uncharacterized protein n=1 Tax=Helobdella robusta TaxID=6412 RepID=T1FK43_HELRO|nr:hypothetical protein HELRODRAFT_183733 [Helobdella robusta]ESO10321.1 hypothetical protein HELRODRAFT_183733 [Helobdella robusta]
MSPDTEMDGHDAYLHVGERKNFTCSIDDQMTSSTTSSTFSLFSSSPLPPSCYSLPDHVNVVLTFERSKKFDSRQEIRCCCDLRHAAGSGGDEEEDEEEDDDGYHYNNDDKDGVSKDNDDDEDGGDMKNSKDDNDDNGRSKNCRINALQVDVHMKSFLYADVVPSVLIRAPGIHERCHLNHRNRNETAFLRVRF